MTLLWKHKWPSKVGLYQTFINSEAEHGSFVSRQADFQFLLCVRWAGLENWLFWRKVWKRLLSLWQLCTSLSLSSHEAFGIPMAHLYWLQVSHHDNACYTVFYVHFRPSVFLFKGESFLFQSLTTAVLEKLTDLPKDTSYVSESRALARLFLSMEPHA